MKKIFLILLIVFTNATKQSFAENKVIDSLRLVLNAQKNDSNKVKTLLVLSQKLSNISDNDTAYQYANKALNLSSKLKLKKLIANCYMTLGDILESKGEYAKALQMFSKSIAINTSINNIMGISQAYTSIGIIYLDKNDYPKALLYQIKSLKICEQKGYSLGVFVNLEGIGSTYYYQNNYEKAFEYYSKALKKAIELNSQHGIASCNNNIGIIYHEQKNYDKALTYYSNALKIYETIENRLGAAKCYANIGIINTDLNNFDKAKVCFAKAINIDKELNVKNELAICLLSFNELNLKLKNFKLVKEQALQIIQISQELGEIDNLRLAHDNIAKAEFGLGNYKEAYNHQVIFKKLTDSIFNDENTQKLNDIKTNYEVEKKEVQFNAISKIASAKSQAQIQKQKLIRNSFVIGFGLMILLAFFIFRSYKQKQKANIIISKQKEDVELQRNLVQHKNREILSSIEYAKRIQFTLLASNELLQQNLSEHFLLFQPKDIVSGDFYWATKKDTRFYLAVCDSTGHGVPGAFMSVLNATFLNEAINEKDIAEPHKILNHVRQRLVASIGSDGAQDGMDCTLLCFDKTTDQITYAAANHKPILIINNQLVELEGDKIPVGKSEKMETFTLREIPLSLKREEQELVVLYLFTDGYADQFGGPKGKKYSKGKFKELLLSIQNIPMNEQREALYNAHIEWRSTQEQVDDICVIGVRV